MHVGRGIRPRLFDGARLVPIASAFPRHEPQRPTMLPLLLPLPLARGQEVGAWLLPGWERRVRALRGRSGTALQAAAAEAGDSAEPDPSPPAARGGKGRRDKPPPSAPPPPPQQQQQQQSALPADVSGRIDAYLATLNDEQQGAVLCSSPSVRVKAGPGR